LAPQTQLHRHTGIENRTGEFIRIHIPLIVPEGDIFFECNDDEVHWDDIFAFDNQLVHSAHNLTDEGRLIYLIDVRRTRAGLPPGQPYNSKRQRATAPIYIRKSKE
jgi:aspartyl/asparaginyl beta-hydroxylase (cupin superfamily)